MSGRSSVRDGGSDGSRPVLRAGKALTAMQSTNAIALGRSHVRGGVLVTLLAFASVSVAADWVKPTLDLSSVVVEITWIADSRELAEIRKRYESRVERSWSDTGFAGAFRRPDDGIKAFSVLGKRDGAWICLIFVERPKLVNDTRTLQLGHELAHCLLGTYH